MITNPEAYAKAKHYAAQAATLGLTREAERLWNFALSYLRDAYEIQNVTP